MTISLVNQRKQPKGYTFINPVIILIKEESLKKNFAASYIKSLKDESKCNLTVEPIQVNLAKINGKN